MALARLIDSALPIWSISEAQWVKAEAVYKTAQLSQCPAPDCPAPQPAERLWIRIMLHDDISRLDTGPGPRRVKIYESLPESVVFHALSDHELEALTSYARPVALNVCTMAVGVLLGLVPYLLGLADGILAHRPIGPAEALSLLLAGGCAAIAFVTGWSAWQGHRGVSQLKATIRSRNPHLLDA